MSSRLTCLAFILANAPLFSAQTSTVEGGIDGAVAPADTWYTRGGSASRSGATATLPVEGELAPAWTYTARGTIDSEPLVWNQGVFVSSRDAEKGRAWIEWLDLDTGERIDREDTRTDRSLEPSVWRNRLVLRSGPKKLSFYRLARGKLSKINDYRAKGKLSAPLLFENQAFVIEGGALVALKSGRSKADWRREGTYIGRPSLRGEWVYALEAERSGKVHLVQVDRADGSERRRRLAAVYPHGLRSFGRQPLVQVFEGLVFLHYPAPVPSSSGPSFACGYLLGASGSPALIGGVAPVIRAADKILGFFLGEKPGLMHLELHSGGRQGLLLSDPEERPGLFRDIVAPTLAAGKVAYFATMAIDVEEHEVLWTRKGEALFPLVPARDTVLVVDGAKTLSALRSRDLMREEPIVLAGPTPAGRVDVDALVLRNGEVSEGAFAVDWKARTLLEGEQSIPFSDVLLLLDQGGRPLVVSAGAGLGDAVRALGMSRAAPAYAAIAKEGVTTRDVAFLGRIAAKARAMGSEDEALQNVEKRIVVWSRKPPKNIDREAVAALEEREREVDRRLATTAFELLEKLDDDAPERLRLLLLRATLRDAPDHAGAMEAVWRRVEEAGGDGEVVRGLLAADREDPAAKRAQGWIEYLLVADARPTSLFSPPTKKTGLSTDERALGRATTRWRPDLIGVRSDELRIFTPLADPGILAQCLATGHLVTDQLDAMFAGAVVDVRPPMTLYLYESKQEYQSQSASRGEGEEGETKYRAGHYSPMDNLQHVYMPEAKDARERVLRTYAHELTHNWAQMRCPLYGAGEAIDAGKRGANRRGYWIVEGFARFVQEFRYDFEAGVADPLNPRARSLDAVVHARTLHKWDALFRLSSKSFHRLSHEPRHQVRLRWRLGRNVSLSDANLFYDQAAATVHFLYHGERGTYRDELLAYLKAYYTGDEAGLDVQEAFGLSPDELGERVRAFSREMLEEG